MNKRKRNQSVLAFRVCLGRLLAVRVQDEDEHMSKKPHTRETDSRSVTPNLKEPKVLELKPETGETGGLAAPFVPGCSTLSSATTGNTGKIAAPFVPGGSTLSAATTGTRKPPGDTGA